MLTASDGPMIVAFLEHLALRVGIVPRPAAESLLWSGLQEGYDSNYTQRLGDHHYLLQVRTERFEGIMDGSKLFTCSTGARVVTNLVGKVTELWGIDDEQHHVELQVSGRPPMQMLVKPNEVWSIATSQPKLILAAPFVAPFF